MANSHEYFKWTTVVLGSVLVSIFGMWVAGEIGNAPSEEKVIELVKTHAPYVEDRKLILEGMQRQSVAIEQLTNEQRDLVKTINRFVGWAAPPPPRGEP